MAPIENGNDDVYYAPVPSWIDEVNMENATRESIGAFERITAILRDSSLNCSSIMLRITVEVELSGGCLKEAYFILKAPFGNDLMVSIVNRLQLFTKEEHMYHVILPKFVQLYKDAGKTVKFAPKAFKFDRNIDADYVLLEDLNACDFKNANTITGLDLKHMEQVLTKLAEFHAASACYVEQFGTFGQKYTVGIFSESNRDLLKEFNSSDAFLTQLKKWKNAQQIYEKLANSDKYLVDRLLEDHKVNPREFNVLNHGDCSANNILFQYDPVGNIKETVFVDFQVNKYGTPAYDLYYVILSSAAMDIKLAKFDYMVRFYYDRLVENLKLLQYYRPLPKLKNLHSALLKNGLAAYMVVSKVLPILMLEKSDALIQDENKMKVAMYTNHKYVKAMTEILPWLDNRGLLDWQ